MRAIRLSKRLWFEYTLQLRRRSRFERRRQFEETLIVAHLDMVERIARHLGKQPFLWHVPLEDLVAAGRLGLCEAASRYHPRRGQFEPYAYRRVKGAIIDPHRRRGMKEEAHVSLEELCERLGFAPASFDTDPAPRPDHVASSREIRRQLLSAIDKMNEPERSVLVAHLHGKSQIAIAQEYGRSLTWLRSTLTTAKSQVSNLMKGRAA